MLSFFIENYSLQSLVVYEFDQTPKISTYLFAICAGPYTCHQGKIEPNYPVQRVFHRRNLSKINPDLLTQIASQSIRNYEHLFKFKFPFSKLDLVLCPHFKYGGMENAGCITFSESSMSKSP